MVSFVEKVIDQSSLRFDSKKMKRQRHRSLCSAGNFFFLRFVEDEAQSNKTKQRRPKRKYHNGDRSPSDVAKRNVLVGGLFLMTWHS